MYVGAGTKQEMQERLTDNDRTQQHAQESAVVLGAIDERKTVREANDQNAGNAATAVAAMAADADATLSEATWAEREAALTSTHVAALEVAVQQAEDKVQEMVSALSILHRMKF